MAQGLEPELCPLEKDMAQWFERRALSTREGHGAMVRARVLSLREGHGTMVRARALSLREGHGTMVRAPSFVH